MRATAGIGRAGMAAGGAARRGGPPAAGGFSLGAARTPAMAGAAAPLAAAAPEALLALQGADPATASAAAAHAEAMLDQLGALQRALVTASPGQQREALEGLAAQLAAMPEAGKDPVLAEIQAALALRAAIELARRGG